MEEFDLMDGALTFSAELSYPSIVVESVDSMNLFPDDEYSSGFGSQEIAQLDNEPKALEPNISEFVDVETVDDNEDLYKDLGCEYVREELIETEVVDLPLPETVNVEQLSATGQEQSLVHIEDDVTEANTLQDQVTQMLLGLNGIEAEDMNSLMEQFENQSADGTSCIEEVVPPTFTTVEAAKPTCTTLVPPATSVTVTAPPTIALSTTTTASTKLRKPDSSNSVLLKSQPALSTVMQQQQGTTSVNQTIPPKQVIHISLPYNNISKPSNLTVLKDNSQNVGVTPSTASTRQKPAPVSLLKRNHRVIQIGTPNINKTVCGSTTKSAVTVPVSKSSSQSNTQPPKWKPTTVVVKKVDESQEQLKKSFIINSSSLSTTHIKVEPSACIAENQPTSNTTLSNSASCINFGVQTESELVSSSESGQISLLQPSIDVPEVKTEVEVEMSEQTVEIATTEQKAEIQVDNLSIGLLTGPIEATDESSIGLCNDVNIRKPPWKLESAQQTPTQRSSRSSSKQSSRRSSPKPWRRQSSSPEVILNKIPDYMSVPLGDYSVPSAEEASSATAWSLLTGTARHVTAVSRDPTHDRDTQSDAVEHSGLPAYCSNSVNTSGQQHIDGESHSPNSTRNKKPSVKHKKSSYRSHRHHKRSKRKRSKSSESSSSSSTSDSEDNSPPPKPKSYSNRKSTSCSKHRRHKKRSRRSRSKTSPYSSSTSSSSSSSCSRSRSRSHHRSMSYSRSRSRSQSRTYKTSRRHVSRSSSYSLSNRSRSGSGTSRHGEKRRCRSSSSERSESSRSRSRSHDRKWKRKRVKSHRNRSGSDRSASPMSRARQAKNEAHDKAMAERRVVYVGGIPRNYSPSDLRRRFERFGEIENTSVHFRRQSDNYGFVTYFSPEHAQRALDGGNKVPGPTFNLCYGGRRLFCKTNYADLDGCTAVKEEWALHEVRRENPADDFDLLLRQTLSNIKR